MMGKVMGMKMHMRLSCKLSMKRVTGQSLYVEKADFKNLTQSQMEFNEVQLEEGQ